MAIARRISLYEREIRVHLGTAALEVLFQLAETLSEGQRDGGKYFGSTMITLDLERAGGLVREPCDAASARRVAELLARDARVQARARDLATTAAVRSAGTPLGNLQVELRARAAGPRVHVDVDVEGETP